MSYQPSVFDHVISSIERLPPDLRSMLSTGKTGPGMGLVRLSMRVTAELELAGEQAAAATLKHQQSIFEAVEGVPPTAFSRLGSLDARVRRPAQEQIAAGIAGFLKARMSREKTRAA
ncbi:MAG: hypothetical protein SGJ21_05000 [Alphaproteobacteria bacterium]|nr:hypothetical protein [Alphaproteobacteria bacterium]